MKAGKFKGIILILAAAALWGSVSIFLYFITPSHIDRMHIIMFRSILTSILMVSVTPLLHRKLSPLHGKDCWIFLGNGTIGMLLFTVFYWWSMSLVGVSIAAILIYIAPVFTLVLSAVFFGEKLTVRCIISLFLAVFGVALVSGISGGVASLPGIAVGLFAGFLYSLNGIWSRFAIQRGYDGWSNVLYSNIFCAICSTVFSMATPIPHGFFHNIPALLGILGMSVFCILLPWNLYAVGLESVPSGRASMLISAEPAAATIIGVLIFHETLSPYALLGIVIIIIGVCLLSSEQVS